MGISGIFKEIGPGERQSLIALSASHHATHSRPFRLAIDTSIWLFQIQASKGGSNPALRTFYYRLLRLLTHNIHPLFVFDGPNKPTFKRNKKVGGPGVRVASVPEFLAKQLLKEFGFPWHVAPGEAEAECAVLQREGVVDAVMSEDVDTLMFGSGVTIRNWTAEGKGKVPTHVNVYKAEDTLTKSGLDREGMILVAMMSGGDYIVEGIPGCGPRVACDAARAGFGSDLCEIARRKDVVGLRQWRERLQREINTNESKFFTRKNKLVIPEDFPSREVLGYYIDPCVSPPERVERLRESLRWDQDIDLVALRNFTADAFDWRCISGAKKFVRNLAPAILVREVRLRQSSLSLHEGASTYQRHTTLEADEEGERAIISTIHGKRTHASTDNSLEYRVSFIPMTLVPIDLSIEDEDDAQLPAGAVDDLLSEAENEWATVPNSTPAPGEGDEDEEDASTTKTRGPSLYDPTQPEKVWLLADFLKKGCPIMVGLYEDGGGDHKALLKARREARSKAKGDSNVHTGRKKPSGKGKKKVPNDMPADALMAYATVTKSSQVSSQKSVESTVDEAGRAPLRDITPRAAGNRSNSPKKKTATAAIAEEKVNGPVFQRMSSQWLTGVRPSGSTIHSSFIRQDEEDDDLTPKAIRVTSQPKRNNAKSRIQSTTTTKATSHPGFFAQFAKADVSEEFDIKQKTLTSTPKKKLKRPSIEDLEMSSARSQRTIDSYFSPTPKKPSHPKEVIDLLSSSPSKGKEMPPPPAVLIGERVALEGGFLRDEDFEMELRKLTASVTKRKPRRPMKRAKTAPVGMGEDDDDSGGRMTPELLGFRNETTVEILDLASPSPVRKRKEVEVAPPPTMGRPSGSLPTMTISPPLARRAFKDTHFSPPTEATAPLLRRSPRTSLTRATSSSSANINEVKTKKHLIQLRASLAGRWKLVEVTAEMEQGNGGLEMLDLTGDIAGGVKVHGEGKVRGWRKSGVEVLDLTEE